MKCCKAENSMLLAVNIPADGLFLTLLNKANGDFSEENCTRIIKDYACKFLEAKPDIILLNVCYRRCLTPSNVFDSYLYDIQTDANGQTVRKISPVTEDVSSYFSSFFSCARILLQNGIDIYRILTEYIKGNGCKVYFSVRMNDHHYSDNPAVNSSFALKDNGKHTINGDGVSFDFSQKEVQNYYYQYVKELIENYNIDGIELDWLRSPPVLPAKKRSDLQILNDYMQQIRKLIRGDHAIDLAVRVLPCEQDNLNNGLDVCQWIADGTVDTVTIENWYIPTVFEMPISQWRSRIAERNTSQNTYRLLCGSDWGVSCIPGRRLAMTPALVRGFANECISNGADGIYLFNFFEENDNTSFELVDNGTEAPYLKSCFSERMKTAKALEKLPRRYIHIGLSNERYPIVVKPNKFYEFQYQLKNTFHSCKLAIGCNGDMPIFVSIGHTGSQIALQTEPVPKGFEYIPESPDGNKVMFIYSVSQAAPFVKSAILPCAENELLDIRIQNASDQDVHILWIELYFE